MKQGDQSIRDFTNALLAERLLFMGMDKSDQEVRNTIITSLSNRSAQEFTF